VKLLLDTCAFLWLLSGERPIPTHVRTSLADAELWLSTASVWEIAVKFAKGTLRLPERPERLVPAARTRYRIAALPIDEESALHVVKLPNLHADPFDRMLVSQAIVHGLAIVTPDPLVTQTRRGRSGDANRVYEGAINRLTANTATNNSTISARTARLTRRRVRPSACQTSSSR